MSQPSALEPGVTARSIGPYSIVTLMPLHGEILTAAQVAWLFDRRLSGLLADFAMLKADSPTSRVRAYEQLVKHEPVPLPLLEDRSIPVETPVKAARAARETPLDIFSTFASPEDPINDRLHRLAHLFSCLGVGLRFDCGALKLSYEPPNDPGAWSFGEVTEVATFDQKSFEPVFGGLYCPRIFGPTKDYVCACGKVTGMRHRGTRCDHCLVEITMARARRRRFGHIVLASPVVPRHLRIFVEALFGDEGRLLATLERDGGLELETALRIVDVERRLAEVDADDPRRRYIEALSISGVRPPDLLWHVIPVLPPERRLLSRLDDGKWATSDQSDHYFLLIDRNAQCRDAQSAPGIETLIEARTALTGAIDDLLFGSPKRGEERARRGLFDLALHCLGDAPSKVDFSGRAEAIVDSERKKVGVPTAILEELARPIAYGELEKRGLCTTIKAARAMFNDEAPLRREIAAHVFATWPLLLTGGESFVGAMVEPIEGNAFRLPVHVASRLGHPKEIIAHLPLNVSAIEETRALVDAEPTKHDRPTEGALAHLVSHTTLRLDRLMLMALKGSREPITTPQTALLAGGLPVSDD